MIALRYAEDVADYWQRGTDSEVLDRVAFLSACYPNRDSDERVRTLQFRVLVEDIKMYPLWAIDEAIVKHRRTSKWFPQSSELRLILDDLTRDLRRRALHSYALHWLTQYPREPGWGDDEWWSLRCKGAASAWARSRGIIA